MSSGIFNEALSKTEISTEKKMEPREPSRDIETRLDFLAKMYASNKAKRNEEDVEDFDGAEQD